MKKCLAALLLLPVLLSAQGTEKTGSVLSGSFKVSTQNLLQSSRFTWQNGTVVLNSGKAAAEAPDTLRILGIRAEFQEDDDDATTGNGSFDLTEPATLTVDAPPHDLAYFEAQLQALANYYAEVSGGMLVLLCEIAGDVFTLPREMGEYNTNSSADETDRGMAELFRDAVMLADDANVNFPGYDCFIVFHAGVGKDINLGYDTTPKDIPSAFLSYEELIKQIGGNDPNYPGISVQNGSFYVKEGLLLPETENQEGFEIGLLGTATLYFGLQLGMPPLWNTQTGQAGIGKWGLMDQGSGNFSGLIPARPCAWTRMIMGWETPAEAVADGAELSVACAEASGQSKSIRVDIHEHEYYLIENRHHDPNGDGVTRGWNRDSVEVTFLPTGQIQAAQPFGVITRVEEYDYDLPGSGLLIWHIDESVIAENWSNNRINGNPKRRGVSLEEADGAEDIGETYEFLSPGSGAENGVLHDAWFKGNDQHMKANRSVEVIFGPRTHPATRSNDGGNSRLVFSNFSDVDTVMQFTLESDLALDGFPVKIGRNPTVFPVLITELVSDRYYEIVLATTAGRFYAWHHDGTPFEDRYTQDWEVNVQGDTSWFQVPLLADWQQEMTVAPMAYDLDGDKIDEIIGAVGEEVRIVERVDWSAVSRNQVRSTSLSTDSVTYLMALPASGGNLVIAGYQSGKITAFRLETVLTPVWSMALGSAIRGFCQYPDNGTAGVLACTAGGQVASYNSAGAELWKTDLGQAVSGLPVAGILNEDGIPLHRFVWFVPTVYGGVLGDQDGSVLTEIKSDFSFNEATPAIADLDNDDRIEIAMASGCHVVAWNHNGTLVDHFPLSDDPAALLGPVFGHGDDDGSTDIIAGSLEGNIRGYNADGTELQGFPLSAGNHLTVMPAMADIDDDYDYELLAVSGGRLMVWDLDANAARLAWPEYAHDSGHSGLATIALDIPVPSDRLMPPGLVYNYPNPAEGSSTTIRYRLESAAEVTIHIFDLAGELITEMTGPGVAFTDNEVVWDLSDVTSGVYLARVCASANGKEAVAIIKIAVAK